MKEKINETHDSVIRIEQKMKARESRLDKHEQRICNNEDQITWNRNKIYLAIGGVSTFFAVLQFVFGV